jgi:hypothetical protein
MHHATLPRDFTKRKANSSLLCSYKYIYEKRFLNTSVNLFRRPDGICAAVISSGKSAIYFFCRFIGRFNEQGRLILSWVCSGRRWHNEGRLNFIYSDKHASRRFSRVEYFVVSKLVILSIRYCMILMTLSVFEPSLGECLNMETVLHSVINIPYPLLLVNYLSAVNRHICREVTELFANFYIFEWLSHQEHSICLLIAVQRCK